MAQSYADGITGRGWGGRRRGGRKRCKEPLWTLGYPGLKPSGSPVPTWCVRLLGGSVFFWNLEEILFDKTEWGMQMVCERLASLFWMSKRNLTRALLDSFDKLSLQGTRWCSWWHRLPQRSSESVPPGPDQLEKENKRVQGGERRGIASKNESLKELTSRQVVWTWGLEDWSS